MNPPPNAGRFCNAEAQAEVPALVEHLMELRALGYTVHPSTTTQQDGLRHPCLKLVDQRGCTAAPEVMDRGAPEKLVLARKYAVAVELMGEEGVFCIGPRRRLPECPRRCS